MKTPNNQQEMSSKERIIRAARRGGGGERIPVAPYMGNHGAKVAGEPLGSYCRSGERMANAQIRAWEIYRQDVVVAQSDTYYIAEGFGVGVDHYPDSIPSFKHPAIGELSEVDKLIVPKPTVDGRMPVYLDAIRRLADHFAGEVAVRAPGSGSFTLASHLLGTENFLYLLADAEADQEPETIAMLRRLMDKSTEALIAFAKACLEAGATIVQSGDSLASVDMISSAMYRKWAWPYEKRFFAEVNPEAHACGAATLLHICGNMTSVLPEMRDTGADILELDHKVDLATARRMLGDTVCLMGNLDPTGVLLQGTPKTVRAKALAAIDAAGPKGFILGSGCEVCIATPGQNLQAMIDTARACGGQKK